MGNLLFEIGTEEIPSGYISPALRQMEGLFKEGLRENRLGCAKVVTMATPRRLSLYAEGIPERQPPLVEEIQGPAARVAFDKEGQPTRAALGFAKAQGVEPNELKTKETPKGAYVFAIKTHAGEETMRLLSPLLTTVVRSLGFPKKMKWKGPGLLFARPIRWIVALLDQDVIPLELNGITSGRTTFGHPFLSGKGLSIKRADLDTYKETLRKEKVLVDVEERKALLREGITSILAQHGSQLKEEELLEEVTFLVEYPCAVECTFPEEFLRVPQEVVETVMKEHQRYFPVEDAQGRLLPRFVVVTNRGPREATSCIEGNERVLKARLADAKFFWEEDRKVSLWKRLEGLKEVVFHEKLGSYWERVERIDRLSGYLALRLGLGPAERETLHRSARLCKADLLTQMVGEFPKLQGVMGYHYAREEGEREEVARAILEHYLPRFAGDRLPETQLGVLLSLADKFDALCGCFSIGLVPTGSQDPYALRRQAQGIIRILEDENLNLSLKESLVAALENFPGRGTTLKELLEFFRDRLYQTFLERGYRYDIINAVLAAGFDNIADFSRRLGVISRLSQTHEWQGLVTVVERTFNIGKKAVATGEVEEELLQEKEERQLWELYQRHRDKILSLIDKGQYEEASMEYYTSFAQAVHNFFDKVFVNVEDQRLRNNRLLLLKNINELYSARIADLAQIVPPEDGGK
ncbi:MAG: glycine--tRNA ligase subunit beta [Planctomycetes bacterium]|nr:glycine--tRNA ligase subunit beta [Planctomycetota bacterium]